MSEAEVTLGLAFHLLNQPCASQDAVVAIDGAQVRVKDKVIFDIKSYLLKKHGWKQTQQCGKNDWQGTYEKDCKKITVKAQPGIGDVVVEFNGGRWRAECKGGPTAKAPGSREYPTLRSVIGHLVTTKDVAKGDIMVAAVPNSKKFRELAESWISAPLMRKTKIGIALVDQDGKVDWFPQQTK